MRSSEFLNEHLGHDKDLLHVFTLVLEAIKSVSDNLDLTTGYDETINIHGEQQLAMDVQSDLIFQRTLCSCNCVALVASEEQEEAVHLNGDDYCVVYDPLDGSSLFDVNMSVGSIVGIYPGNSLIGRKPSEMVGSLIAVYGPTTTVLLSFGDGVYELLLKEEGFILKEENIQVASMGKYFAPGNLRATKHVEWYRKLVNHWMKEGYTLRYSGGMCPDVNHIFGKGGGIFTYPGYPEAPNGKLRLLYECGPMAYLMEQAGGKATDGKVRILDKTIESLHQRTPIFIGSSGEVDEAVKFIG